MNDLPAIALRSDCRHRRHARISAPAAMLLLSVLAAAGGCTRAYYRNQADREVASLVNEKNLPGRWGVPNLNLQYDPRSRYFDPNSPDRPAMPPDDPYSHTFMHYVDGMRGARNYHRDGNLLELPNPAWREMIATYAETRDDGTVRLTVDGAVQMAVIHEPDFRTQLEELYLSALDVSTERFRFAAQFFGGVDPLRYAHQSKQAPAPGTTTPATTTPAATRTADSLSLTDDLELHKRFAAGGELIVGVANSIIWQFAGPDTNANASLIHFNFVQPLLRLGGRRFILEQLTIVERTLLANLRAFERYRQGFYTNLVIGDGGTTGAQRRGGFFGGTGLTGFSGQGSGGFGEVGNATGFGGRTNVGGGAATSVTGGFAGGGAGTLGGYVGLLQQMQQIRNQQQNLNAQQRTLKLLTANLEAGTIDIAQVDQFRQNIETSKATLLQARIGLQNSIETWQRTLIGLPPDLPLELDDEMIRQFQFIDPQTNDLFERAEDFVDELGNLPPEPDAEVLRMAADQLQRFREETIRMFEAVRADLDRAAMHRNVRTRGMTADEAAAYDAEMKKVREAEAELEQALARWSAELAKIREQLGSVPRKRSIDALVVAAKGLATLVQEASLVQVRGRVESITLDPVKLEPQFALEIARANRLDWMNNRAALVDTWRLIAFNARNLMSGLNLTFDGSLGTLGDNPVKFRSPTGTLRAGLEFDAPLTRLIERNNYRSILITYQRDRRQLIQFEDGVNQTLRQTLRTLEQLEMNLEIQRRAVIIATRRVDQTREILSKPPEPVAPGQAAEGLGPTSALNLLTALNDLQSTQNNFMSVWLNHYAARMILVRELGLMELDERNIWIDRPLDEMIAVADSAEAEPLPPDVPQEWLDALDPQAGPALKSGDATATDELPKPAETPDDRRREAPQPPRLPNPPATEPEELPLAPPARSSRRNGAPTVVERSPSVPLRTATLTTTFEENPVTQPPQPPAKRQSAKELFGLPPLP